MTLNDTLERPIVDHGYASRCLEARLPTRVSIKPSTTTPLQSNAVREVLSNPLPTPRRTGYTQSARHLTNTSVEVVRELIPGVRLSAFTQRRHRGRTYQSSLGVKGRAEDAPENVPDSELEKKTQNTQSTEEGQSPEQTQLTEESKETEQTDQPKRRHFFQDIALFFARLPLLYASTLASTNDHYLEQRNRSKWWSRGQFPKVQTLHNRNLLLFVRVDVGGEAHSEGCH